MKDLYSGNISEQRTTQPAMCVEAEDYVGVLHDRSQIRFASADAHQFLLLARNKLGIHVLKPYPDWEVFRTAIWSAYAAYNDVASPEGVRRIKLRYRNQIDLNGKNMNACFRVAPELRQNYKLLQGASPRIRIELDFAVNREDRAKYYDGQPINFYCTRKCISEDSNT